MTLTALTDIAIRPSPNAPIADTRIWGYDVRRLHDLFWASRGLQVVRPGQPVTPGGPGIYLLLTADAAVFINVRHHLKRMRWTGARVLRLRVADRSGHAYRERVVETPDGRLERITRVYPGRTGGTIRVALTFDHATASRWAAQAPGREQWTALKRGAGTSIVAETNGRFHDLASPADQAECLTTLARQWREPGRLIPGIYQWKDRVWLHESSNIDPASRVVGPIWIGAHNDVTSADPVIGPMMLPDARPVEPRPTDWSELQVPSFELMPSIRGRSVRRVSKRLFDIAMSLFVLAVTLPIYPFIMLAIYLEDGRPFFFAHKRQTIGGRDFPCWKFRTMIKDAEKLKARLQERNVCDGPQFYIADDPRLLKCGKFLRRFQFDELPQFFNVLLGHMSVVGPRPSPDKENQFCPAWREARLSVRPGVTGLWQVKRTRLPETDFQEWIRYDLEYVQHQSWRLDIWIILQTFRRVLGG